MTTIHDPIDGWREATPEEIIVIDKIVAAKATAHSEYYCFLSKGGSLCSIQVQDNEDYKCVQVMFIRSKVKSISNTKPAGFYEPLGPASKPLLELYDSIPKEI